MAWTWNSETRLLTWPAITGEVIYKASRTARHAYDGRNETVMGTAGIPWDLKTRQDSESERGK